jgi:hypothetical protein
MRARGPAEAPRTPLEGIEWLASRGAHPWLVRHHRLVLEAAQEIVAGLGTIACVEFDADHVLFGAAIHDAGKIAHPAEMTVAGHAHETAGEELLLKAGFAPHIARACVTHAAWSDGRAQLEDRLVALADKLWKGKRDPDLERALVHELAMRLARPSWEIFDGFDALCEKVAEKGPSRLRRSTS